MMKTTLLALLLGAVLLGVGIACGESDEPEDTLTLEEYVLRMEAILDQADAEAPIVFQDLLDRTPSVEPRTPEEALERDRQRIERIVARNRSMADQVREIDAPGVAKEAHSAYLAGLEDYSDSMTEFLATEAYERIVLEQPRFTEEHAIGERDYTAEVAAFNGELTADFPDQMELLTVAVRRINSTCGDLVQLTVEFSTREGQLCMGRRIPIH